METKIPAFFCFAVALRGMVADGGHALDTVRSRDKAVSDTSRVGADRIWGGNGWPPRHHPCSPLHSFIFLHALLLTVACNPPSPPPPFAPATATNASNTYSHSSAISSFLDDALCTARLGWHTVVHRLDGDGRHAHTAINGRAVHLLEHAPQFQPSACAARAGSHNTGPL